MPKSTHHSPLNHPLTSLSHTHTSYDEMERSRALLDLAISLIDSALDLLCHHLQFDDQLIQPSVLVPGGTVGKHLRHVCILVSSPDGV